MFRHEFKQRVFPWIALLLFVPTTVAAQVLLSESGRTASPVPQSGDIVQGPPGKVPPGVIFVKGAEPSASDRVTPLPEDGAVAKNVYRNTYLGLTYPLPQGWVEAYKGPPPSDGGAYVLVQLVPSEKSAAKGTILITAQDLFFGLNPASNALDLIRLHREHLPSYYEVERPPAELTIAGRRFVRFDYGSSVAHLHWSVLATQIRCHAVEFVFTGGDTEMIESLIKGMDPMQLPADTDVATGRGGSGVPLCVRNYATKANVIDKVDPVFEQHRFNTVPVRVIIGKNGKIRHVHVISAFPDQSQKITDALMQWRFKPYLQNGEPVEVETGIVFGMPRARTAVAATND
jgi:TonB-like protein